MVLKNFVFLFHTDYVTKLISCSFGISLQMYDQPELIRALIIIIIRNIFFIISIRLFLMHYLDYNYLPVVFKIDVGVSFHFLHQELSLSVRVIISRHRKSDVHMRVGSKEFAFSHRVTFQPRIELLKYVRQGQIVSPRRFTA